MESVCRAGFALTAIRGWRLILMFPRDRRERTLRRRAWECTMIVTCISKSDKNSPGAYRALRRPDGASPALTPGNDYVVQSMALWGLHLVLLLSDDSNMPYWHPASLFTVANPHLPSNWTYDLARQDERGLRSIWGYREIVEDENHNNALIDRETDALKIFQGVASSFTMEVARAL